MITVNKYSYLYLSQPYLKSQMASDSNIYNCTAINQYFDTFAYNASLVQNITLQSHNYLHISFDVAFINIKEIWGGITKYGQVDVNGQTTTFSTNVQTDDYKCMPRTNKYYVDGKTNVSMILPHSGNLNLTFSTNNLGSNARLGISNIVVDGILCGNNAELDQSSLTCVCKQGFKETLTSHGNPGHIYYEKQCL
ncbi:hypothetical protein TTHERM_00491000 (macronuclear) [Tetrahymena thermophila SB210]|uniref:Uncharacterized protein n=1 Tax=Tetrahymena thermophila (strain SB210) TaxID=312017 RepID=Q23J72_TETTS|nr:hypothetical protein TTHERM_00491000 [Tetrahymena thermophila SB210]EAR96632.1 hypothetical protein TTHERM_00491000 [Tetrahymena thermophila SB210]|eukprot:XP_001016877.1 hypothetical protein TTHERM_00491000 [Tetrahymena thermophila SB210]